MLARFEFLGRFLPLPHPAVSVEQHFQQTQALADVIVQFPCHPLPFLLLDFEHVSREPARFLLRLVQLPGCHRNFALQFFFLGDPEPFGLALQCDVFHHQQQNAAAIC